jgi:hypothetical protein
MTHFFHTSVTFVIFRERCEEEEEEKRTSYQVVAEASAGE